MKSFAVGGSKFLIGAGLTGSLLLAQGCIATRDSMVALADRSGNVYLSTDTGRSWSRRASGVPAPSSVLIV